VRNALSADGKLYAAPFYGESSFLMYRKDVLKKAGVTMPATRPGTGRGHRPKVNSPDMAGICLRGKPGWGDLGASFTTVLNTFGGTWWSAKPDGSVDKAHGRPARVQAGAAVLRRTCQGRRREGRGQRELQRVPVAVQGRQGGDVVRRDRRGRPARGQRQPGEGQERLRAAPGRQDAGVGWLWSWALAIPKTTQQAGPRVEVHLVRDRPAVPQGGRVEDPGGWAAIPPGTRKSTYEIPQYKKAARRFAEPTLDAIVAAPIDNPGTTKRPGCRASSTSASRSSRTSATSCTSSSRPYRGPPARASTPRCKNCQGHRRAGRAG
jgi:sorbitol/mannitol transport system substrate-binding protein